MSIIRVRKDARYFTASNEPFQDKRLSWETRGLMGYLLTKPNNWTVRIDDLLKQGPAKLTKLRRMLAEARLYGYMNRIRVTQKDGTFDWITEVFESPSQNPNPATSVRFSTCGLSTSVRFSTCGLSTSGKPADIVTTDEVITESSTTTAQPAQFVNAFTLYEQNIGPLTPLISDDLKDLEKTYSEEWVMRAITEAAFSKGLNIKYIRAILAGYKERGSPDIGRDKTQYQRTPKTASKIGNAMAIQFDAQGNVIG